MNDSYVELLVKRKSSIGPLLGRNALIGLGALIIILAFLGRVTGLFTQFSLLLGVVIGGVFCFLAYLMHQRVSVEYEYLCLGRSFSVDRISNASTRKKLAEYNLDNLELFAPVNSSRVKEYANGKSMKTVDYSSGEPDAAVYAMVISQQNMLIEALVESNDELFESLRRIAPRKVFKD
ncbi:MAG: DUF6106 family protein [Lachnospiraceae bacterium]|nr:DUF6106 family protein [Lachnospiraceae bacterium]